MKIFGIETPGTRRRRMAEETRQAFLDHATRMPKDSDKPSEGTVGFVLNANDESTSTPEHKAEATPTTPDEIYEHERTVLITYIKRFIKSSYANIPAHARATLRNAEKHIPEIQAQFVAEIHHLTEKMMDQLLHGGAIRVLGENFSFKNSPEIASQYKTFEQARDASLVNIQQKSARRATKKARVQQDLQTITAAVRTTFDEPARGTKPEDPAATPAEGGDSTEKMETPAENENLPEHALAAAFAEYVTMSIRAIKDLADYYSGNRSGKGLNKNLSSKAKKLIKAAKEGKINLVTFPKKLAHYRSALAPFQQKFESTFEGYIESKVPKNAKGGWDGDVAMEIETMYAGFAAKSAEMVQAAFVDTPIEENKLVSRGIESAKNVASTIQQGREFLANQILGAIHPRLKPLAGPLAAAIIAGTVTVLTGGVGTALYLTTMIGAAASSVIGAGISKFVNYCSSITNNWDHERISNREIKGVGDAAKRVRARRTQEKIRFWGTLGVSVGSAILTGLETRAAINSVDDFFSLDAWGKAAVRTAESVNELPQGLTGMKITDMPEAAVKGAGDAFSFIDKLSGNNISGFGEFLWNQVPTATGLENTVDYVANSLGYNGDITNDAATLWNNAWADAPLDIKHPKSMFIVDHGPAAGAHRYTFYGPDGHGGVKVLGEAGTVGRGHFPVISEGTYAAEMKSDGIVDPKEVKLTNTTPQPEAPKPTGPKAPVTPEGAPKTTPTGTTPDTAPVTPAPTAGSEMVVSGVADNNDGVTQVLEKIREHYGAEALKKLGGAAAELANCDTPEKVARFAAEHGLFDPSQVNDSVVVHGGDAFGFDSHGNFVMDPVGKVGVVPVTPELGGRPMIDTGKYPALAKMLAGLKK